MNDRWVNMTRTRRSSKASIRTKGAVEQRHVEGLAIAGVVDGVWRKERGARGVGADLKLVLQRGIGSGTDGSAQLHKVHGSGRNVVLEVIVVVVGHVARLLLAVRSCESEYIIDRQRASEREGSCCTGIGRWHRRWRRAMSTAQRTAPRAEGWARWLGCRRWCTAAAGSHRGSLSQTSRSRASRRWAACSEPRRTGSPRIHTGPCGPASRCSSSTSRCCGRVSSKHEAAEQGSSSRDARTCEGRTWQQAAGDAHRQSSRIRSQC